jgi:hypothetical protein
LCGTTPKLEVNLPERHQARSHDRFARRATIARVIATATLSVVGYLGFRRATDVDAEALMLDVGAVAHGLASFDRDGIFGSGAKPAAQSHTRCRPAPSRSLIASDLRAPSARNRG